MDLYLFWLLKARSHIDHDTLTLRVQGWPWTLSVTETPVYTATASFCDHYYTQVCSHPHHLIPRSTHHPTKNPAPAHSSVTLFPLLWKSLTSYLLSRWPRFCQLVHTEESQGVCSPRRVWFLLLSKDLCLRVSMMVKAPWLSQGYYRCDETSWPKSTWRRQALFYSQFHRMVHS